MIRGKFILLFVVVSLHMIIFANSSNDFKLFIKPQYTNIYEELGVYFGFDESTQTVEDKYKHDEMLDIFSIEYSLGYKNKFFLRGYFTNTDGFKFGKYNNDFKKNWLETNYKFGLGSTFDLILYYSRFSKKFEIEDEVTYQAENSKYLLGLGVFTYELSNLSFSDLTKSGVHGILYMGAGRYENNVWMATTNPFIIDYREWKFVAEEDFGFVFFMDIGGLYSQKYFYLGAKLKVGGFVSGEVKINDDVVTDQVITGTIEMQALGGIFLHKNIQLGLDWKINDENNRNESKDYKKDGSSFTSYVTNCYVTMNIQF